MNERTLNRKINRAVELRHELDALVQEINEALEEKRINTDWQQTLTRLQTTFIQDSPLAISAR